MAKPPYDPDALPPELQALLPNNTSPSSNQKSVVSPSRTTKVVLPKSYAQVESLVSPPNSCGLKPQRKRRRNPLTVRLSKGEWEKIAAKAIKAGCTLNSYARAAMLGSDYTPPRDPELVRVLRQYYFELHMQGININQVARQLNAGLISPAQADAMMAILIRSTLQIHKNIREAMAQGEMEK